jgi:hypothetical protein
MDYAVKIQLILALQYLELVESFQIKHREVDPSGEDDEEAAEEEDFFSQVADSVFRAGQWTQELYGHHE